MAICQHVERQELMATSSTLVHAGNISMGLWGVYIHTKCKEMIEEYSQIILTEIFGIKTVNLHLHFLSADTLVTSERFRRKLYYTKLPSTG